MKYLLLLLLTPLLLSAKTSLWKISNGENVLYLGGTIHLLRPTDFPLPAEFDSAYNRAEIIALETDLSGMNSGDFQSILIKAVSYPQGKSIKDDLTPKTYKRLTDFLKGKDIPATALDQFRPPMASILLSQWEIQKLDMSEEGVDMHYFTKMKLHNKKLFTFETIDQQIDFIATLSKDDPDGLILNTIEEMNELPSVVNSMIDSWKTGNDFELNNIIIKEMKNVYPSVYKSLIVDRNKNWEPAIHKMLTTNPIELILVGAGHLVGNEGLLQSLKTAGYTVEPALFSKDISK